MVEKIEVIKGFEEYLVSVVVNLGRILSNLNNPVLEGKFLDVIKKRIKQAYL